MVRITGGRVYDPANGVEGVVKDIASTRTAASSPTSTAATCARIDATGMLVFPGGVDVHTHVAGGALNFARGLVPRISASPGSSSTRRSSAPASAA